MPPQVIRDLRDLTRYRKSVIEERARETQRLHEVLLEDSYHVATLDNDAPVIFEESAAFVDRVAGARTGEQ